MFRRVAMLLFALSGIAACTNPIVVRDVWDGGSSGDGGTDTDGPAPTSCPNGLPRYNQIYTYRSQIAQLIVLLDRSQAMQQYGFPPGSYTRESATQIALKNAVFKDQASINLGLESFPSDPSDPGCQPNSCCAGEVAIPPSPKNMNAMVDGIQCSGGVSCPATVIADSPWHLALWQVRDLFKKQSKYGFINEGNRYLLLVTAGEPSCSSDAHPSDACDAAKNTVTDLETNFDTHIFVVSVGYQPDNQSCLGQIGQTTSTRLYLASSLTDLASDITQIFDTISRDACTVTSPEIAPSQASMQVLIGKALKPVQQGDASIQNGWYYSGPETTSITFVGQACDDYLAALAQNEPTFFGYSFCPTHDDAGPGGWQP